MLPFQASQLGKQPVMLAEAQRQHAGTRSKGKGKEGEVERERATRTVRESY